MNTAITNEVTRADGKYEQLANKSTSITTDSGSDTKYTTVKAVQDYVTTAISAVDVDINVAVTGTGNTVTTIAEADGTITATRANVTIPVGSAAATTYANIWVE